MAQRSIADLIVNLRMNTASFVKELDKSRTLSTAFGVAVGNVLSSIALRAARMAEDVATSLPRAFLAAVDSADELFKSSQKIGISVEALSGLKHAADLSGVSFQQLETGIARLSRNMRDSLSGTNAASKAFSDLAISAKNQDGTLRNTEDVLRDLAERFSKMPDGANKTALAMTLLGRAGANLIPFLNQGAAGFDAMLIEAERLGLVISTKTAQAAEALNDNLQRLKLSATGVANVLVADMTPALTSFTNAMVVSAKSGTFFRDAVGLLTLPLKGLLEILAYTAHFFDITGIRVKQFGANLVLLARRDFAGMAELSKQAQAEVEASVVDVVKTLAEISGIKPLELPVRSMSEDAIEIGSIVLKLKEKTKTQLEEMQSIMARLRLRPPKIELPDLTGQLLDRNKLPEFTAPISSLNAFFTNLDGSIRDSRDATDKLAQEMGRLPGVVDGTAESISSLNLAFSDTIPAAVTNVQELDAAFERMGLTSGMALSGIAAQSTRDFETVRSSGQASARQIAQAFVQAQEDIKAAAESGFETWTKEQEKALRAGQKELEALTDSAKGTRDTFLELSHTLSSGFEDAILGGKGLRDVLSGILEDIGRIILRSTITGPNGILGTLLSGLGGALGGAFGGGGSFSGSGGGFASGTGALTGARAMGGPVTAGGSFLVGERGPEIFSPGVSGTITPNAGTVNVTIQQNNTINTGARPEEVVRALELVRQSAVAEAVHVMVQRQLRT